MRSQWNAYQSRQYNQQRLNNLSQNYPKIGMYIFKKNCINKAKTLLNNDYFKKNLRFDQQLLINDVSQISLWSELLVIIEQIKVGAISIYHTKNNTAILKSISNIALKQIRVLHLDSCSQHLSLQTIQWLQMPRLRRLDLQSNKFHSLMFLNKCNFSLLSNIKIDRHCASQYPISRVNLASVYKISLLQMFTGIDGIVKRGSGRHSQNNNQAMEKMKESSHSGINVQQKNNASTKICPWIILRKDKYQRQNMINLPKLQKLVQKKVIQFY